MVKKIECGKSIKILLSLILIILVLILLKLFLNPHTVIIQEEEILKLEVDNSGIFNLNYNMKSYQNELIDYVCTKSVEVKDFRDKDNDYYNENHIFFEVRGENNKGFCIVIIEKEKIKWW